LSGEQVFLPTEDSTKQINLRTGRILSESPGVYPVDGEGRVLDLATGTIVRGDHVERWGLLEASCALRGTLLGGPGGVIWDLTTGDPLFTQPVLALGATVPTERAWATVDWESGEGCWVLPATGERLADFVLPLCEDDLVEEGWESRGAACFRTALGHCYRVKGDRVQGPSGAEDFPQESGADPALKRHQRDLSRDWPLMIEGMTRVAHTLWVWNSDGLLVALPG